MWTYLAAITQKICTVSVSYDICKKEQGSNTFLVLVEDHWYKWETTKVLELNNPVEPQKELFSIL